MSTSFETESPVYLAVRRATLALLAGAVLSASNVTAGNGLVIDWREVKSGETLLAGADAFDVARLFVALVGTEFETGTDDAPSPPPVPASKLTIVRWGIPRGDGTHSHSVYGIDGTTDVLVNGERAAEVAAALVAAFSKMEFT